MSEAENFKAARESRADVASRAGRSSRFGDVTQQLVEAAFYQEAHRTEPKPSTEDSELPADQTL